MHSRSVSRLVPGLLAVAAAVVLSGCAPAATELVAQPDEAWLSSLSTTDEQGPYGSFAGAGNSTVEAWSSVTAADVADAVVRSVRVACTGSDSASIAVAVSDATSNEKLKAVPVTCDGAFHGVPGVPAIAEPTAVRITVEASDTASWWVSPSTRSSA